MHHNSGFQILGITLFLGFAHMCLWTTVKTKKMFFLFFVNQSHFIFSSTNDFENVLMNTDYLKNVCESGNTRWETYSNGHHFSRTLSPLISVKLLLQHEYGPHALPSHWLLHCKHSWSKWQAIFDDDNRLAWLLAGQIPKGSASLPFHLLL